MLLELLKAFFGNLACNPKFNDLCRQIETVKPSPQIAQLRGKRIAVCSEVNEDEVMNENILKNATENATWDGQCIMHIISRLLPYV